MNLKLYFWEFYKFLGRIVGLATLIPLICFHLYLKLKI